MEFGWVSTQSDSTSFSSHAKWQTVDTIIFGGSLPKYLHTCGSPDITEKVQDRFPTSPCGGRTYMSSKCGAQTYTWGAVVFCQQRTCRPREEGKSTTIVKKGNGVLGLEPSDISHRCQVCTIPTKGLPYCEILHCASASGGLWQINTQCDSTSLRLTAHGNCLTVVSSGGPIVCKYLPSCQSADIGGKTVAVCQWDLRTGW